MSPTNTSYYYNSSLIKRCPNPIDGEPTSPNYDYTAAAPDTPSQTLRSDDFALNSLQIDDSFNTKLFFIPPARPFPLPGGPELQSARVILFSKKWRWQGGAKKIGTQYFLNGVNSVTSEPDDENEYPLDWQRILCPIFLEEVPAP